MTPYFLFVLYVEVPKVFHRWNLCFGTRESPARLGWSKRNFRLVSCCHSIFWFDQILFAVWLHKNSILRWPWSGCPCQIASERRVQVFRPMFRKRVFWGTVYFRTLIKWLTFAKLFCLATFYDILDVASQRLSGVIFLLDSVGGIHLNAYRQGFTILFHNPWDGNFLRHRNWCSPWRRSA